MDLALLDVLLSILHLLMIGFNLFGWIFKATRRIHFWFTMLTLSCWTLLGIWFGLGYCPITDWQWKVKEKLGEKNLPDSFIKYFVDKVTGANSNAELIDILTLGFFLIAIAISIKLNFFHKKKHDG
ncbi:DUF2784 domain-containing protein [Pedobacter sp. UC225_65]|uniref:DUF2784 domain-containing protein n=1 Tax=Pedobacter sp. UC225_65 TaxID=3350173 RepID=UPI00366BEAAB